MDWVYRGGAMSCNISVPMYRQTPYQSFNEQLADLRASMSRKAWLRGQLADAARRRDELGGQLDAAQARVLRETRDVERLEGDTVLAWFFRLIGLLDNRLEKERAEVATALLVVEETEVEIRALDSDVGEMEARLAALAGVEERYQRVRAEAMAWVQQSGDADAWKLFEIIADTAETRELYREVWEALQAAAHIDDNLERIRLHIVDIGEDIREVVGNRVVGREQVERLRDLLALAGTSGNALGVFRKELEDVRLHPKAADFGVIDRSLSFGFGAIFFTKLVGEWMERGHPEGALRHVDRIHGMIKSSVAQLEHIRQRLENSGVTFTG